MPCCAVWLDSSCGSALHVIPFMYSFTVGAVRFHLHFSGVLYVVGFKDSTVTVLYQSNQHNLVITSCPVRWERRKYVCLYKLGPFVNLSPGAMNSPSMPPGQPFNRHSSTDD